MTRGLELALFVEVSILFAICDGRFYVFDYFYMRPTVEVGTNLVSCSFSLHVHVSVDMRSSRLRTYFFAYNYEACDRRI